MSLCRPADNISRQFVHRSGPPIRLYILKKLSPCSRYARFCIRCACSSLAITCTPSRALKTLCGYAGWTAPLLFACNKVGFLATRCIWCINARNHVFGVSNNKGAHQPVHPLSLISAFVIRLLERLIHLLQAKFQVSNLCSWVGLVWVSLCWKPQTQVLSLRRGPFDLILQTFGK